MEFFVTFVIIITLLGMEKLYNRIIRYRKMKRIKYKANAEMRKSA